MDTPNPAMDSSVPPENETAKLLTREESEKLLKKECNNLLLEIGALALVPILYCAPYDRRNL